MSTDLESENEIERNCASAARLLHTAFKRRWPVSQKVREEALNELRKVLLSSKAQSRQKIAAARAIIAAEGQNQDDEMALLKLQWDTPAGAAQPNVNVQVNVATQQPQESIVDRGTLAEALALMADMGFINLSDKGRDLVEKSAALELDRKRHNSGDGSGGGNGDGLGLGNGADKAVGNDVDHGVGNGNGNGKAIRTGGDLDDGTYNGNDNDNGKADLDEPTDDEIFGE
jgi:hypothetical protein